MTKKNPNSLSNIQFLCLIVTSLNIWLVSQEKMLHTVVGKNIHLVTGNHKFKNSTGPYLSSRYAQISQISTGVESIHILY